MGGGLPLAREGTHPISRPHPSPEGCPCPSLPRPPHRVTVAVAALTEDSQVIVTDQVVDPCCKPMPPLPFQSHSAVAVFAERTVPLLGEFQFPKEGFGRTCSLPAVTALHRLVPPFVPLSPSGCSAGGTDTSCPFHGVLVRTTHGGQAGYLGK